MSKNKVFFVVAFIVLMSLIVLIFQRKLSTNRYCTQNQRCVNISSEWEEVRLMRGERSMILLKIGFFGEVSEKNDQMDLYFLDEREGQIDQDGLKSSKEIITPYGSAFKIDSKAPILRNSELSNFFSGSIYIPDHLVIIKCSDFDCLKYINGFSPK